MRKALLCLVVVSAAFADYDDLLICHADPGGTSYVEYYIGGYPFYESVTLMDCRYYTPSLSEMEEYVWTFRTGDYGVEEISWGAIKAQF